VISLPTWQADIYWVRGVLVRLWISIQALSQNEQISLYCEQNYHEQHFVALQFILFKGLKIVFLGVRILLYRGLLIRKHSYIDLYYKMPGLFHYYCGVRIPLFQELSEGVSAVICVLFLRHVTDLDRCQRDAVRKNCFWLAKAKSFLPIHFLT
jgi:hypothetical protein